GLLPGRALGRLRAFGFRRRKRLGLRRRRQFDFLLFRLRWRWRFRLRLQLRFWHRLWLWLRFWLRFWFWWRLDDLDGYSLFLRWLGQFQWQADDCDDGKQQMCNHRDGDAPSYVAARSADVVFHVRSLQ